MPYGNDFRVHIIRTTEESVGSVVCACIKKKLDFRDHNAFERLSMCELKKIFEEPLINHMVICVKGFYRRATLIPNKWKLRIGAIHEYYTKTVDNNVQVQGLVGRMTGYWRELIIEYRHKIGPYRTHIKAIEQYENSWHDPLGYNEYQTFGFKKNSFGKITKHATTFLNPKCIEGLTPVALPEPIRLYDISGPHSDISAAWKWCDDNLVKKYPKWVHNRYDKDGNKNQSGDYIKLGSGQCKEPVKILSDKATRALSTIFWGTNTEKGCAIARPVLDNETHVIKYIVIYAKKLIK
jgi:hypothetical protein